MAEPLKPGETYTEGNTTYEVLEEKFCGFVPTGKITSEVNNGIKVILVNVPREPWSSF